MPSFEIPDGPTTVKLTDGNPRTGSIVFAVNNKSGEVRAGRIGVQVAGESKAEWFTIEGERERNLDPATSATVSVRIAVPGDVAAGNYPFRLRVVAVNDPDNDHADGPATTVEVPPAGEIKPPSKWWIWALVALAVIALGGGLAWWLLHDKDEDPPVVIPTETPTPTPTPTETVATTATVPDLVGKTLTDARPLSQDFDFTPVVGAVEGKPPETIQSQSPGKDVVHGKGLPLKVTYDPGVEVPALSGQTIAQAVNSLNRVGLHVQSQTSKCQTSGVSGQIVDQVPPAPQRVAGNSGVAVTVAVVNNILNGQRMRCGRIIPMPIATFRPQVVAPPVRATARPIVRDHRIQR